MFSERKCFNCLLGRTDESGYLKPTDKEMVQYVDMDGIKDKNDICGGGHYASIPDANEYEDPLLVRKSSDMSKVRFITILFFIKTGFS